jgi:hypothetical protein
MFAKLERKIEVLDNVNLAKRIEKLKPYVSHAYKILKWQNNLRRNELKHLR